MTIIENVLPTVSALFLLACAAFGQVKQTENTLKLADGQAGEKASIADMAWLSGL